MNTEFYIAVVGEVFDGYSEMLLGQEPVFVKHFALKDQQFLDYHYQRYFKKIRKRGVQTDEESLQLLYDNDLWSEKKENEIKSWKDDVAEGVRVLSELVTDCAILVPNAWAHSILGQARPSLLFGINGSTGN